MAEPRSETIELRRAASGHDLWSAVEAAQYARLVEHDEPRTDAEAARMRDLLGLFSECAEQWEGKSASDQTLALEQLGSRLTALERLNVSVYWAVIDRKVLTAEGDPVDLPVAVLAIARSVQPSITRDLPGTMTTG